MIEITYIDLKLSNLPIPKYAVDYCNHFIIFKSYETLNEYAESLTNQGLLKLMLLIEKKGYNKALVSEKN